MKKQTRLLTAGREPQANFGIVNPPVYHASTILFPTVAALEHASKNRYEVFSYALTATPTSQALEEAIAELEGYDRAIAVPSGLAAIVAALLAYLEQGDHLLMVDSCYGPSRRFCDTMLKGFGVQTTYYDPMIGADIASLMRPQTKVVFTESPGSLTFEVQDLPAICKAAHTGGAKVILDNTWGGGIYLDAPAMGVDVSIQAVTKYIGGHSDIMMGSIAMNDVDFIKIKDATCFMGYGAAPDDCFMALRGIRSMNARMPIHQQTGLKLAHWLEQRPEVAQVLHPALPSCPGHDIWKRDFSGSCGLFGFVLQDNFTKAHVAAMLDDMQLFAMGYSWGGFESLIVPYGTNPPKSAKPWTAGQLIRIHAGLEDVDDLIADLEAGFVRLNG